MSFAFGRPSCGRAFRWGTQLVADVPCVCVVDVRWGALLADVGVGAPTCLALRWGALANLGEAVLKSLPPSQNLFLSILQLVF
jgi:hypothetical protein